jgi:hypothetical protein
MDSNDTRSKHIARGDCPECGEPMKGLRGRCEICREKKMNWMRAFREDFPALVAELRALASTPAPSYIRTTYSTVEEWEERTGIEKCDVIYWRAVKREAAALGIALL